MRDMEIAVAMWRSNNSQKPILHNFLLTIENCNVV